MFLFLFSLHGLVIKKHNKIYTHIINYLNIRFLHVPYCNCLAFFCKFILNVVKLNKKHFKQNKYKYSKKQKKKSKNKKQKIRNMLRQCLFAINLNSVVTVASGASATPSHTSAPLPPPCPPAVAQSSCLNRNGRRIKHLEPEIEARGIFALRKIYGIKIRNIYFLNLSYLVVLRMKCQLCKYCGKSSFSYFQKYFFFIRRTMRLSCGDYKQVTCPVFET